MKKIALAVAAAALLAVPATASAGNGYGKEVKECFAPLGLSVGGAIQAGKEAHSGVKMTAKTIAESVHCGG